MNVQLLLSLATALVAAFGSQYASKEALNEEKAISISSCFGETCASTTKEKAMDERTDGVGHEGCGDRE